MWRGWQGHLQNHIVYGIDTALQEPAHEGDDQKGRSYSNRSKDLQDQRIPALVQCLEIRLGLKVKVPVSCSGIDDIGKGADDETAEGKSQTSTISRCIRTKTIIIMALRVAPIALIREMT